MRGAIVQFVLWLPVGAIPVANGVVRFTLYGPVLGEPSASLASSGLDILLIVGYAVVLERRSPLAGLAPRLRRGVLWLALSTLSHFLLGHFVFGLLFAELVGKYDIRAGETWGLISAAILVAPWLAGRFGAARRPPP